MYPSCNASGEPATLAGRMGQNSPCLILAAVTMNPPAWTIPLPEVKRLRPSSAIRRPGKPWLGFHVSGLGHIQKFSTVGPDRI